MQIASQDALPNIMMARYYSPETAFRFLSVDPLAASAEPSVPQTWNRYAYAANNPIRFNDPFGLESEELFLDQDANASDGTVSAKAGVVRGGEGPVKAEALTAEATATFSVEDGVDVGSSVSVKTVEVGIDGERGDLTGGATLTGGAASVGAGVSVSESGGGAKVEAIAVAVQGEIRAGFSVAGVRVDLSASMGIGAGGSASVNIGQTVNGNGKPFGAGVTRPTGGFGGGGRAGFGILLGASVGISWDQ